MGQVPEIRPHTGSGFGVVGNGQVARHFIRYFDLMAIPFRSWHRTMGVLAGDVLGDCDPILLLITDSQIEKFIEQNDFLIGKNLIHFSGSLTTPLAQGFHPLMTFSRDLYDLEKYRSIPFVVERGRFLFNEIFPGLQNPHFYVPSEKKNFYHALCVLSGNFTVLLWEKFFSELEGQLDLPRSAAFPYLNQVTENLKTLGGDALTGPLQRKDLGTIGRNLKSLDGDPFQKIYEAFAEMALHQKGTAT